jgi:hypothetical protein
MTTATAEYDRRALWVYRLGQDLLAQGAVHWDGGGVHPDGLEMPDGVVYFPVDELGVWVGNDGGIMSAPFVTHNAEDWDRIRNVGNHIDRFWTWYPDAPAPPLPWIQPNPRAARVRPRRRRTSSRSTRAPPEGGDPEQPPLDPDPNEDDSRAGATQGLEV